MFLVTDVQEGTENATETGNAGGPTGPAAAPVMMTAVPDEVEAAVGDVIDCISFGSLKVSVFKFWQKMVGFCKQKTVHKAMTWKYDY